MVEKLGVGVGISPNDKGKQTSSRTNKQAILAKAKKSKG